MTDGSGNIRGASAGEVKMGRTFSFQTDGKLPLQLVYVHGASSDEVSMAQIIKMNLEEVFGSENIEVILSQFTGDKYNDVIAPGNFDFAYDPPSVRSFEHRFADAGFEAVYIPLTAENRDTIGSDAYFASLVSSCHGVYFTGGNQSLGIYALQNADGDWNAVGQAVQDLFARGGFLAGTSAGAHMLGSVCFQDADSHAALTHAKPTEAVLTAAGVVCGEEGALYGGLPCDAAACGAALTFDSHFGARGRLARLCTMQRSGGAAYAVGLDEATGIAVTGGVGTVYGAGTVTVFDNRSAVYGNDDSHFSVSDLRVFVLSAGDQFDFTSGTLIASSAKEAPAESAAPEQPEDFLSSGSAQTRALLTFALSGEKSIQYPVAADGEEFTLHVEKSDDFSVVSNEKNYAASALSDLPQCAVSGLLLSIS